MSVDSWLLGELARKNQNNLGPEGRGSAVLQEAAVTITVSGSGGMFQPL